MSFKRPTLPEIISRVKTDIETRLDTGKLLARSYLAIMATAFSGAVHLLHGHIQWATRQLFVLTASKEYLEIHASTWGIKRPSATFSIGSIDLTGLDGTVVPVGLRFQRSDSVYYVTTSSGTIASGVLTVTAKAVQAGETGNADAGTSLSIVLSEPGVDSNAVISAGGFTNGADVEDDEQLRARVLDRIQQPPHGGAKFDYEKWAKEVLGVTRAWVYPLWAGPGTVSVTFVLDVEDDIIPDAAKVTEVQSYIDDETRRPTGANVTVFAPVAVALDLEITLNPDNAETRLAVENSLRDMLKREAEPGGVIYLSKIREAVSIAAGENDNIVSIPNADVTHATGEIAVIGAITWI